ncbi:hypothetical protein MTO96_048706 [Rhipicephalus appendiculatus]
MEAAPAPPGTVVCTVSNLMRADRSAFPPDGICDLLYFDSFYKDNKNVLADGFRRLEAAYLTCGDLNNASAAAMMTRQFDRGILEAVRYNAGHYGFLNLYRAFSTPTAVTNALLVLKNDTLPILERVRKSHPQLPLSISVGLSGRYYAPKRLDSSQRYLPFEDCTDFPGPRYGDPANVCPSFDGAEWKFQENDTYQYEALLNEKRKLTFTFDSIDPLRAKKLESLLTLPGSSTPFLDLAGPPNSELDKDITIEV